MSLRDRLHEANTARNGKCLTCHYLQTLPAEDAHELARAIADPNVTGAAIAYALNAEGYEIGQASVQRHRKNGHDPQ